MSLQTQGEGKPFDRSAVTGTGTGVRAERTARVARRLQRSLDLIDARLASTLSLDELAAAACLSTFHFARVFRRAIGVSPHRYVIERRVRSAQTMLASRNDSLAQIALAGGFGSQANFTRVFRKLTGMTPGRYRELSTS